MATTFSAQRTAITLTAATEADFIGVTGGATSTEIIEFISAISTMGRKVRVKVYRDPTFVGNTTIIPVLVLGTAGTGATIHNTFTSVTSRGTLIGTYTITEDQAEKINLSLLRGNTQKALITLEAINVDTTLDFAVIWTEV